ncbi:hypothetical protein [Kineococcus glutinatus]|uniref:Uncharacterized protein n=1 Tax=Kineococcus glutinatus TaxID=1070872 RepID=A0ABP9HWV4_9ACTN
MNAPTGGPSGPGAQDPRFAVGRRSITRVVAAFGAGAVGASLAGSVSARQAPEAAGTTTTATGAVVLEANPSGDCAPLLQALYDDGVRAVSLRPQSTYLLDSPVFLDSDDPFDSLVIYGNGAELALGPGLGRTDAFTADPQTRWAFFPNTRRDAFDGDAVSVDVDHRATGDAVGGTPRLVVHQVVVDGQGENRALAFFNRCAGRFNDVVMTAARTLVSWFDYCDAMVLDHCQARLDEVDDAWLLYQVSNGDGIVLLSPKSERGIGLASLWNCKGATIASAISGPVRLNRCRAVSILGGHAEGDVATTSAYVIRSSQVTIDSSLVYPSHSDDVPGIVIDDADDGLGSVVTLRDVGEMVFHRDGARTVKSDLQGDVGWAPVVSLSRVQRSTRLVAERVYTQVGTLQQGSRWLPSAGFRIVSADPDVTAALGTATALWQRACGSWELVHRDGWQVLPAGGAGISSSPALRAPEFLEARASSDGVGGSLRATRLEYVAALRDAEGNYTELSAVVAAALDDSSSVRLRLRTSGPGVLVLWRRRGPDVAREPEVSVSIPVQGPEVTLYDTGEHVGGVPWGSGTGVVPAEVAATNRTRDLILLSGRPVAQPLPMSGR